jgi:hypothetical protein
MKRSPSGWQLRSQRNQQPVMPDGPAGFDMLLYRLGITEKEAPTNPSVRSWVRLHYRTSFVPEKVLDAVGVTADFI